MKNGADHVFNGMSRTATNGNIKYLKNLNKQTNLAFSLQLQAQAALKYPGFTRKIYVKDIVIICTTEEEAC